MAYDLFISYSRKDNQQGQVTALKEQIEADYREFANEELHCFFDMDAIAGMDDWRHRILQGLSESSILLLVLSPAYLDSPYCEWEIVEFLKYEHARSVGGQGVAPIYFVDIPGLDDEAFPTRAASWLARVRRRNHVDLRQWQVEGRNALAQRDVRARLDDLERSLHARVTRLRRLRNAPGNLPAHNPKFVGRESEMQHLHESVALGRVGVLTTVQGVGGLGKTALAIQYACAYADFYSGGRWIVKCAGETSLAGALRSLDLTLGVTFDEREQRDDTRAAQRILAELERRAVEGAQPGAPRKQPPEPRTLLILDNVDRAALLMPPETELISGRAWMRVLATTRLGPNELGVGSGAHTLVPIDELPEGDALRLVESYQQSGRFASDEERAAALELVRMLGGFTLAVEVLAVHLGERAGRVTCAAFLERMRREGLEPFDRGVARQTAGGIRHGEKLLGATLQPTIDGLGKIERAVLTTAALCPPDAVPVPWLRDAATASWADLGSNAEPGYDDPWLAILNQLIGLRLLQVVEWADDQRTPRVCRIHRMVQSTARRLLADGGAAAAGTLAGIVQVRAGVLHDRWIEWARRWEILPIATYAGMALDDDAPNGPSLANIAARCLENTGEYRPAEPLYRRALAARERVLGPEHPDTLTSVQDLAEVLEKLGQTDEARSLRIRRLATLANKEDATPPALRTAALDAYRLSDYALATTLLQRVLDAGFEIPGPCCHLARIALLLDDVRLARARVAQAWNQRVDAPPYVIPRILWLRLACVLASPEVEASEPGVAGVLGRLKATLHTPGAQMDWAMEPVLEHLQERLSGEDHALLTALVAALSKPANVAALDAFPAWRDAAPPPLD
jgi:tetratricopeptide (TPR) repeat protein